MRFDLVFLWGVLDLKDRWQPCVYNIDYGRCLFPWLNGVLRCFDSFPSEFSDSYDGVLISLPSRDLSMTIEEIIVVTHSRSSWPFSALLNNAGQSLSWRSLCGFVSASARDTLLSFLYALDWWALELSEQIDS